MASSESNTFEEQSSTPSITATTERVNMPNESNTETSTTATAITETELELDMADKSITNTTDQPSRAASYRGLRLSQSENSQEETEDSDMWWSEVENTDLLLDQVPNVTAVFTPSPEAILEKSISVAESETILKDDNFERLHKIADKIKMSISEHAKNKELEENQLKERKISEGSDKESLSETSHSGTTPILEHKEQSLEEFKEELRTKRLQRQNAVQDLREEIATLRQQLQQEREINKRLRRGEHVEESSTSRESEGACALNADEEENPLSRSRHANIELANAQLALQMAQSENISLRGELAVVQKQVVTLKEVIACCKQMLAVKEEQCNEIFR